MTATNDQLQAAITRLQYQCKGIVLAMIAFRNTLQLRLNEPRP